MHGQQNLKICILMSTAFNLTQSQVRNNEVVLNVI